MEIGEFIEANRRDLLRWGNLISKKVIAAQGPLLKVPAVARVKDPQSARAKQLKKAYADPTKEMTDLVGVRFVALTSSDALNICSTIQTCHSWDAKKVRDPNEESQRTPESFVYQSHHFELRPPNKPSGVLCCEVQVRTLLQHTIAELSHDAMYKSTQDTPSQARRLVARSMALMETTDELLCRAMEAVREAEAPAREIKRVATWLSETAANATSTSLMNDLLAAYASDINDTSAADLQAFVAANDFIREKIQARSGEGIFGYPSAAIISYWLVEKLEQSAVGRWPFPGAKAELKKMYSDLGKSV